MGNVFRYFYCKFGGFLQVDEFAQMMGITQRTGTGMVAIGSPAVMRPQDYGMMSAWLCSHGCGINVCQARLQAVARKDVLMLERFDRLYTEKGYLRFGLVSGLTILDCEDSYLERERWSYPLLAENLRRWSASPERDCVELFRRMVFNAAVTNDDDHPRNHAVLHRKQGWCLSPAYDLVPMPLVSLERRDLALTVGTYGRTASVYNLLSQCTRFGLSADAARKEIDQIVNMVRGWREYFFASGVSAQDVKYIAPALLPDCFFFEASPES